MIALSPAAWLAWAEEAGFDAYLWPSSEGDGWCLVRTMPRMLPDRCLAVDFDKLADHLAAIGQFGCKR